jgi:class 3 adenylate cyclase
MTKTELDAAADYVEENWGTNVMAGLGNPSIAEDPDLRRWISKNERLACSAREAATYMRHEQFIDVRQVLPSLQLPTLVLHRKDAPFLVADQGRHLAEHIAGARFVTVPGADMAFFTKPNAQILNHIEEFVTGQEPSVGSDRALAAILFTDIVGSTERGISLGDRRWNNLLESHNVVARTIVEDHGGRLVRLTGDGVLAVFDGPGRAIRCGFAIRDALDPLGITIRAALHTGEVELGEDDGIGGIGVHVAARVLERAEPGELLVSAAVPLLVVGSGIEFEDRGEYDLKGLPGTWRLFAVEG